jgi:hypothetical protein
MARNRIIYQSEALYVSKHINSTETGEHVQLRRVQSANYGFNIERQDVNEAGQLARIDALVLKSPTVSLDFSYYPSDGYNEKALGFYVQNNSLGNSLEINFASGQMGNSSGQNFYIITAQEGEDLNTLQGNSVLSGKSAIAIGNGFLSNYTFNASVGNFPTVSVTVEGLNIKSSTIFAKTGEMHEEVTGNFVLSPTVNPIAGSELLMTGRIPNPSEATGENYISALRPGDITMSFDSYTGAGQTGSPISILEGVNGINIQSASITLPLSRTPIERLGSRFAFARAVDFPIVATLNVNAILNEIQSKSLAEILDDNSKRDILLKVRKPGSTQNALIFKFKGSQLQSESFSSSIGSNKIVDLTFQTQIGGPTDANNGIYLSGSYTDPLNGQWGYADTGVVNIDSNIIGKYFAGINNEWYTIPNNWYSNSLLTTQATSLPSGNTNVIMTGSIGALVDLSNALWVQPASIDTTAVTDISGICFVSGVFSGIIYGNATFLNGGVFV